MIAQTTDQCTCETDNQSNTLESNTSDAESTGKKQIAMSKLALCWPSLDHFKLSNRKTIKQHAMKTWNPEECQLVACSWPGKVDCYTAYIWWLVKANLLLFYPFSLSKLLKDSDLSTSVLQHFSHWGLVLNVKVFRDWMQRPYGFVQFAVSPIQFIMGHQI